DALSGLEGHVDHRPVSVQLDEPAAVYGPEEASAGGIVEGPPGRTTEQGHGVPSESGGALGPIAEGLRKLWQSFTNCRQRSRGTSGGDAQDRGKRSLRPNRWEFDALVPLAALL